MKLSSRAMKMEPSATLAVTAKAKELKRAGKPVISFGAGEPDFASPPAALEAARAAMDRGETHYTPGSGIVELREAVCGYYQERFGLSYEPTQVLVGSGAKPLVYEAFSCILDPGDEVLLFAPAWVSYVEQIRLCDGREVVIDTAGTDYIPRLEDVRRAVTDRTRAILINTPCNPTGVVYDGGLLRGLAAIAEEHDLWIIFDEIYERLTYGGKAHENLVALVPEAKERTIVINGVSKAFAMTGWRIGYALGPKAVMDKMAALQGHLTSNACSISQWASVGALQGADDDVRTMHAAFEDRRNLIVDRLSAMPHIAFAPPEGAFYAFVDVRACLGMKHDGQSLDDDVTFCSRLLEAEYVAAVPGSAFLAPGFLRFSYANAKEEIEEGMKRFHRFLEQLRP
jgi:aspartate aminotransferase